MLGVQSEGQGRPTRAMSSGSSTSSSLSRHKLLCNKAPVKPNQTCKVSWSHFLAAYQNGEWDSVQAAFSRKCPKAARKVLQANGKWVDNQEYYNKYHYLVAPPLPREKLNEREETVTRYGLNEDRAKLCMERYIRHAKKVFKVEYASIAVACSNDRALLMITDDGEIGTSATYRANTICDHAMLLSEHEVFVLPDIQKDWRFENFTFALPDGLTSRDKEALRFYASAPIIMSNSEENAEKAKSVQIGRLVIMRNAPWPDFDEDDAELLMDIAKMAQEALENDFLLGHSRKVQRMQRENAALAYHLNLDSDLEVTKETARDGALNSLVSPDKIQRVVDVLKDIVQADSVFALDVTEYRLQGQRGEATRPSYTSPRGSAQSTAYPAQPWLRSSSISGTTEQVSDADAESASAPASDDTRSSGFDTAVTSPSEGMSTVSRNQSRRKLGHSHSSSTAQSFDDAERYLATPGASVKLVAQVGSGLLKTTSSEGIPEIGSILTRMRRERQYTSIRQFKVPDDDTSSDEDDEDIKEDLNGNPLSSIVPSKTKVYCTIPVFSNDRIQPLFLFIVTFDYNKIISESEKLFMTSQSLIVSASCLREQARMTDRAQLDFIRSVQHELRTPLNGILGITDFLRQSLVSGDMTEKLDLTEDGLLASLLESIRLSGVNLSTILDDVLDFGAVSGVRSKAEATTCVEEMELVREIEDTCQDELEHMAMHERQDKAMKVYRGFYAVPTLVIKISPDLDSHYRTSRTNVRKILSKFVANALRYSDENEVVEVIVSASQSNGASRSGGEAGEQWIDFVIQDTGIGMSQEFLDNSLLKPFSKADSFSQGVGLGVTIGASLISQMGGHLRIQSELGKGTRVLFSLPFTRRPTLTARSSLSALYRPYQVKTACFWGFKLKGQQKIIEMIRDRLIQNGIRIVEPGEEAELVVCKESALTSDLKDAQVIPKPVGPKARVLIVTRNALRQSTFDMFDNLPIWLFRPPFGPSSLDTMDEFLREESPIVLNRIPAPPTVHRGAAIQGKVLESDQKGENAPKDSIKEPKPEVNDPNNVKAAPAAKPMTKDIPAGSKSKAPADVLSQHSNPAKPFRVLVVEDNHVNLRLITAVLQKGGYHFAEAKDGVEAVEQFKAFEPSVVLLDISLPLMDGFEACLQMRAHTLGHKAMIVATTALSSTEDKIKGLDVCGMDDWRTKPLSIKTLRADLVVWSKEWDAAWVDPSGTPLEAPAASSGFAIIA